MERKNILTEEEEKQLKMALATNEMYEKTKEEAKLRGDTKTIEQVELAQKDILAQLEKLGYNNEADKEKQANLQSKKSSGTSLASKKNNYGKSIYERLAEEKEREKEKKIEKIESMDIKPEPIGTESNSDEITPNISQSMYNDIDPDTQYDLLPLPSNGECYRNKISRVPVGYLTAYDENLLLSPNLYRDGLVIDFLLKNKILNEDINPDELVKGDVDAIILWLRATSYGIDYPVTVTDPDSGEKFDAIVDLSKFKPKEFKLKGDENGYFTYVLPHTKAEVKFRYLTRKDERDLDTLSRIENKAMRSQDIKEMSKKLKNLMESDKMLDIKDKQYFLEVTRKMEKWASDIDKTGDTLEFNKFITNTLEMQIMAINGNYDKEYIREKIMKMPASDSIKLRTYILENEPGIDFRVTIQKPENLGGGSFETFLEWGDFVFWSIA